MKPKPLTRPSELVLSAIYNLDEAKGSSSQDIVEYITGTYGINTSEIKEKVDAALKRGMSFGLISREIGGLYKLRDINELLEVPAPQKVRRKRRRAKHVRKEQIRGAVRADEEQGKRKWLRTEGFIRVPKCTRQRAKGMIRPGKENMLV